MRASSTRSGCPTCGSCLCPHACHLRAQWSLLLHKLYAHAKDVLEDRWFLCMARSWLPLYAGEATLYTDACPAMPWFLAGALVALAFALLHTFSMVVAFDGLSRGRRRQVAAVPAAHLVAALLVRPFARFLTPCVKMQLGSWQPCMPVPVPIQYIKVYVILLEASKIVHRS